MTAIYNFPEQKKGDSFAGTTFSLEQDGQPMDLTGAAVKVQVRLRSNPTVLGWEWNSALGTISVAGNEIYLQPRSMSNIASGVYAYDLQVTYPGGSVVTYIEGTYIITEDVTQ